MAILNNTSIRAGASAAAAVPADPYRIKRSARFDSNATAYLNRTPGSAGNRTTWTWSAWVKRSEIGGTQRIFSGVASNANDDWTTLLFNTDDKFVIGGYSSIFRYSNERFRDVAAWYHITVATNLMLQSLEYG